MVVTILIGSFARAFLWSHYDAANPALDERAFTFYVHCLVGSSPCGLLSLDERAVAVRTFNRLRIAGWAAHRHAVL